MMETDTGMRERHHARVVAPPPLIYAAGFGLGILLERLAPLPDIPAAATVPGIALIAAGVTLMATFVRALARAGTAIDPYRSTKALVTTGPFRVSRNPGYLGMAAIYTGAALLADTLWALILLPLVLLAIRWGVIAREERYLEGLFGATYLDYKRRTGRWLSVPGRR